MQGDWNAKVGADACKDWKGICGPYSNKETNERGLRLLEFASYNNLKLIRLAHTKYQEDGPGIVLTGEPITK